MSLTLNDIKGRDIHSAVQSVIVGEGISKDEKPYNFLDLIFRNGWTKRVFLTSDAMFGLLNACEVSRVSSSSSEKTLEEKSNLPF